MAHLSEAAVAKINEICDRYADERTPLMMILSDVQKEYGYIPLEVQELVSDKFSEILGIKPGETTKDGLFTLDALRCIGACGIAPAVSINGKVYPKLSVNAVPAVIEEYKNAEANV